MDYETFRTTETFRDTMVHSRDGLITGDVVPKNCHVVFALISNLQAMPTAANILRSLAVFCQENPDVATQIWEAIEKDVQ